LSLRTAAYSGIRMPTLNELYRPFVVFPVTTQANAALGNEELRGIEAGIDFAPSRAINLSVTAFYNKVKNAIANVTIATNIRQRQNVDAITAKGIELGASLHFGRLSLEGSLALTDAEVEDSTIPANRSIPSIDGKRPAQTPRIAASTTLAWRPKPGWRLSATLRHVGAQYEDDLQVDVLPAATTLDAYAEMPLAGPFSLVLRGENLTDENIITRNQAGSIDLGAPRTLWAGVRVRVD
jgi:outer membrane receptor protein involved in Fe transport